jgi:2-polyprenyl-3-methyl-5-hydroxy-6-metoxy-1,4-benzoquinol methylase
LPLAHLGYDVTGIDLDPRSVRRARRLAASIPNARFLVETTENLRATRFDAVLLSEVFEHVTDSYVAAECWFNARSTERDPDCDRAQWLRRV